MNTTASDTIPITVAGLVTPLHLYKPPIQSFVNLNWETCHTFIEALKQNPFKGSQRGAPIMGKMTVG
eukprot:CAMPEP_0174301854 /NCGR_PEP_ID=MMETSP0809-20121228/59293_1 /TAXON_ID=73025 ORGANISM="Eutreptiella gymnastica-like, Strain CCMP1594" /NCGR_SAMPLE_ID=MMETSP0809 /ASSEMBLY_ACC=CAM_ASM_000658 /LENGTH=66 /DNA_ID=CAMNT_0015407675 /DNA_START=570 /DNA_END=770 /DNA_ORIENTATION=+